MLGGNHEIHNPGLVSGMKSKLGKIILGKLKQIKESVLSQVTCLSFVVLHPLSSSRDVLAK